ncbi:TetR family transcriptional regulator [Streptomyces sp. NPDC021020]|uniref:acyl-CoA-like ligand-binding transcription factor n=1 Tax=Streptomyces sp. NPDC021020 TaxID=3365109 RepID=UPI00378D68B2
MDGQAEGLAGEPARGLTDEQADGQPGGEQAAGLRERKKQQTRRALSEATIALAVKRGWANVRVEDIAAAVNVSERTFRNYFSGKAEAVAATHLDRMARVARAVGERPAVEPLFEAIGTALRFEFAPEDSAAHQQRTPRRQHREAIWEVLTEPAVQAEVMRADQAAQGVLAEAIAARTGTDAVADLYPKLVASAVGAAMGATLAHWLRADPPVPLAPLIDEALHHLRTGLSSPDGAPAES